MEPATASASSAFLIPNSSLVLKCRVQCDRLVTIFREAFLKLMINVLTVYTNKFYNKTTPHRRIDRETYPPRREHLPRRPFAGYHRRLVVALLIVRDALRGIKRFGEFRKASASRKTC